MTRAFAWYSALRIVAFVGCYGLLVLVGARGLVAVLVALLLSSLVSLVVLRSQRDAVAGELQSRREARHEAHVRMRAPLDDPDDTSTQHGGADTQPGSP